MAIRRPPPEPDAEYDLAQPPPRWTARWLWAMRWRDQLMGGAPSYAQNHRLVFCAGPLEPALARVRGMWAKQDENARRRCWDYDDHGVAGWKDALSTCPHHAQLLAFCDTDCPDVARVQRIYDDDNAHAWANPQGPTPKARRQ